MVDVFFPRCYAFNFCFVCQVDASEVAQPCFKITLILLCRSVPTKKRIDESDNLTLDHIRRSLVRQEDSIIFGLIERAQYCYNEDTYDPDAFSMDGFRGSLVEYMVRETERLHAKVCVDLSLKSNF